MSELAGLGGGDGLGGSWLPAQRSLEPILERSKGHLRFFNAPRLGSIMYYIVFCRDWGHVSAGDLTRGPSLGSVIPE